MGRYAGSEYGISKLMGENLFFDYHEETGADVLVYRFPNLYGKWCRPNYNSAVATFCHNIAHDLPITVNDESVVKGVILVSISTDIIHETLAELDNKADLLFVVLMIVVVVAGTFLATMMMKPFEKTPMLPHVTHLHVMQYHASLHYESEKYLQPHVTQSHVTETLHVL